MLSSYSRGMCFYLGSWWVGERTVLKVTTGRLPSSFAKGGLFMVMFDYCSFDMFAKFLWRTAKGG